jgi:hypothetical protein
VKRKFVNTRELLIKEFRKKKFEEQIEATTPEQIVANQKLAAAQKIVNAANEKALRNKKQQITKPENNTTL